MLMVSKANTHPEPEPQPQQQPQPQPQPQPPPQQPQQPQQPEQPEQPEPDAVPDAAAMAEDDASLEQLGISSVAELRTRYPKGSFRRSCGVCKRNYEGGENTMQF